MWSLFLTSAMLRELWCFPQLYEDAIVVAHCECRRGPNILKALDDEIRKVYFFVSEDF
jgi:hypothetical protein